MGLLTILFKWWMEKILDFLKSLNPQPLTPLYLAVDQQHFGVATELILLKVNQLFYISFQPKWVKELDAGCHFGLLSSIAEFCPLVSFRIEMQAHCIFFAEAFYEARFGTKC